MQTSSPSKAEEIQKYLNSLGIADRFLRPADINVWGEDFFNQVLGVAVTQGVFIHGGVGRGKTQMAVELLRYLAAAEYTFESSEHDFVYTQSVPNKYFAKFWKASEFLVSIRDSFGEKGGSVMDFIDRASSVKFLVLDDLGAQKVTDWVLETLLVVFDRAYDNRQHIIVTSNNTPQDIAKVYGERIASRLFGQCKAFELRGKDMRL